MILVFVEVTKNIKNVVVNKENRDVKNSHNNYRDYRVIDRDN